MALSRTGPDDVERSRRSLKVNDDTIWIVINSISAFVLSIALYLGVVVLPMTPFSLGFCIQLTVLILNALNLITYAWRMFGSSSATDHASNPTPVKFGESVISSTGRRSLSPISWNAGSLSGSSWLSLPTLASSGSSPPVGRFSPEQRGGSVSPLNRSVDLSTTAASLACCSTPVKLPRLEITDESVLEEYISQHPLNMSSADCSMQSKLDSSFSLPTNSPFQPQHNSVYQLSMSMPELSDDVASGSKLSEDASSVDCTSTWSELKISHDTLFGWTENLRKWLSKTIFVRVSEQIDVVNSALCRHGITDIQIGEASLDQLRKCCDLSGDMSSLKSLLPFLSVSTHQQYVVARIKKLSKGGCLNDFRWNGGGSFDGKPWQEHLPSDAAITMHLFCSYLNARLPARPSHPDGRTFTEEHTCVSANSTGVKSLTDPLLRCEQVYPPQYSVSHAGRVYRLTQGRNNLFHALLLFIYILHRHFDDRLGEVYLGSSGLNMLSIIEEDSLQ